MEISLYASRYRHARDSFYLWRNRTATVYRLLLALSFACLTGTSAFLKVYTPFSPVPFTAQVLVVLLSGCVLGRNYGAMSQAMYLGLGIIGMPWFAGGEHGVQYAFGATGGYLVGFILAAAVLGHMADSDVRTRTLWGMMPTMMLGVAIIYGIGALWLSLVLDISLWQAAVIGIAPFIAVDIVKALMAAGIGRAITTRNALLL